MKKRALSRNPIGQERPLHERTKYRKKAREKKEKEKKKKHLKPARNEKFPWHF